MNRDTEEKLTASLTEDTTELVPFLPYLLQDLWQLGGSPDLAVLLLEQYLPKDRPVHVLDLACGKGAISIRVAEEIGANVKGVDLLPEFVEYAKNKARERGVADLCKFVVADANDAAAGESGWDAVVFCASGNVLGPPEVVLPKLKATVRPKGLVLFDESYLSRSVVNELRHDYEYITLDRWDELFRENGLRELAKFQFEEEEMAATNKRDLTHIRQRAQELAEEYPDKKELFMGYVKSREAEVYDLENSRENVVWLLRRL